MVNVTSPLEWEQRNSHSILVFRSIITSYHNRPQFLQYTQYWYSLTYEGRTIAQCIRTKGINALVFCAENTIIPPSSNAKIPCKAPKVKSLSNIAPSVIFEPSYRHRANYVNCHTYDGLVTLDDHATSSGSFNIVITNNSNLHDKVTKNQTLGTLKSCNSDQICTIHRLLTFEPKSLEGEGIKLDHT